MDALLQILLFGGLFFLMMRFGCGSHMFSHGSKQEKNSDAGGQGDCCGGSHTDTPPVDNQSKGSPPKNDIDPVCGKTVFTDKAKTSLHDGLVYFFCSTECREAFEISPSKYAEKDDGTMPLCLEQSPAK